MEKIAKVIFGLLALEYFFVSLIFVGLMLDNYVIFVGCIFALFDAIFLLWALIKTIKVSVNTKRKEVMENE